MAGIFFHPDGRATRHPTSLADAKRRKRNKYDDDQLCPNCRDCTIKYTKTQQCIHCARLSALAFYNTVAAGHDFPADYVMTDEMRTAGEVLPDIPGERVPVSPHEALARGYSYWVRPDACPTAGHIGMRTIDGDCWSCERERRKPSPRQKAIEAGERWYTPETPCKRCGTYAERRVDNGQCASCQPPRGAQREQGSLAAQVMEQAPQLIMERSDAIKAGMPVYRTGRPCRRGHVAFRYTSTGACIDCMREDRGGGAA